MGKIGWMTQTKCNLCVNGKALAEVDADPEIVEKTVGYFNALRRARVLYNS